MSGDISATAGTHNETVHTNDNEPLQSKKDDKMKIKIKIKLSATCAQRVKSQQKAECIHKKTFKTCTNYKKDKYQQDNFQEFDQHTNQNKLGSGNNRKSNQIVVSMNSRSVVVVNKRIGKYSAYMSTLRRLNGTRTNNVSKLIGNNRSPQLGIVGMRAATKKEGRISPSQRLNTEQNDKRRKTKSSKYKPKTAVINSNVNLGQRNQYKVQNKVKVACGTSSDVNSSQQYMKTIQHHTHCGYILKVNREVEDKLEHVKRNGRRGCEHENKDKDKRLKDTGNRVSHGADPGYERMKNQKETLSIVSVQGKAVVKQRKKITKGLQVKRPAKHDDMGYRGTKRQQFVDIHCNPRLHANRENWTENNDHTQSLLPQQTQWNKQHQRGPQEDRRPQDAFVAKKEDKQRRKQIPEIHLDGSPRFLLQEQLAGKKSSRSVGTYKQLNARARKVNFG